MLSPPATASVAAVCRRSSSIAASSPGSYSCQVTASNQTGSTAQGSAAFTVIATASPPPVPLVSPVVALARVGDLSVSPHSLRAASSGSSITAKKTGATVRYTDSQASTTTFTVLMLTKGFKRNGRCVANRPAGQKHAKRCTFYRAVGSFRHADKAGPNSFHFAGRIRGKKLKPGAYRLKAIPQICGAQWRRTHRGLSSRAVGASGGWPRPAVPTSLSRSLRQGSAPWIVVTD
jgi:hypothetical protein